MFCFGYPLPIRNIRPSPAASVKSNSDKDKDKKEKNSAKEGKCKGGKPKADPGTELKTKSKKKRLAKRTSLVI